MTKDEALKLALEALKTIDEAMPFPVAKLAQAAIEEALAQPERDPWREAAAQSKFDPWRAALAQPDHIRDATKMMAQPEERNFCSRCGKRTADLFTIHTCTPPIAADLKAFHGFPSGSVSTLNAGGKCVTAGETAPIKEIDPNAWAFDRGLEST